MHIDHILCIHSSVKGHLGYFHLWAVGNAVINMGAQTSVQVPVLVLLSIFLEVDLLGHMVILLLSEQHRPVFHDSYTIFHSHPQYTMVPIPPHFHQKLFSFLILFFISHSNGREMAAHWF